MRVVVAIKVSTHVKLAEFREAGDGTGVQGIPVMREGEVEAGVRGAGGVLSRSDECDAIVDEFPRAGLAAGIVVAWVGPWIEINKHYFSEGKTLWKLCSLPIMSILPWTAGDHVALVSSRNWMRVWSSLAESPMMMALNCAKSAVDIALHSASVTTLAVNPSLVVASWYSSS